MTALLWLTAAIMQLAACAAYGILGFGVVFWLLELFVAASLGLMILALYVQSLNHERNKRYDDSSRHYR